MMWCMRNAGIKAFVAKDGCIMLSSNVTAMADVITSWSQVDEYRCWYLTNAFITTTAAYKRFDANINDEHRNAMSWLELAWRFGVMLVRWHLVYKYYMRIGWLLKQVITGLYEVPQMHRDATMPASTGMKLNWNALRGNECLCTACKLALMWYRTLRTDLMASGE